jgi:phosphoribosylglycinamide formyltransferase 1
MKRLAVFASGSGSNAQALFRHFAPSSKIRIGLVFSDRKGAKVLERASHFELTAVCSPELAKDGPALIELMQAHRIDGIVLAGYLRLLPESLIQAFRGNILNIHPSLLPAFGGKGMYGIHVHAAVIAAGEKVSGLTVHEVDEHFDTGRIVLQYFHPISQGTDPERLQAEILIREHLLYPPTVESWFAN